MKLIILNTDPETPNGKAGFFEGLFNEDILIEPNSKIALQSVSVNRPLESLLVDTSNNTITFQCQVQNAAGFGGTHPIDLTERTITAANINDFFDEIIYKTHAELQLAARAEFNVQLNISIRKNLKVDYHFGKVKSLNMNDVTADTGLKFQTGLNTFAANGGTICAQTAATTVHTNFVATSSSVVKGCGVLRCRLDKFVNANTATPAGVLIGLLEATDANRDLLQNPTANLNENTFDFAIMTNRDHLNASVYQSKIKGAAYVNAAVAPFKSDNVSTSDCDILDIAIEQNTIKLIVRTSGGTAETVLQTFPIDAASSKTGYFGVIAPFGDGVTTRIGLCRCSLDPHDLGGNAPPAFFQEDHTVGLGATPRPTGNTAPSIFNVDLASLEVANYLGFNAVVLNPALDATFGAVFTADNNFSLNLGTNTYLIEMLNLQLKSYHSLANGRKNILAPVPVSDLSTNQNGQIQYEPNNYNFIDINNKFEISIRNLQARIIGNDFSSIETSGLAELAILIKGSNE